MTLQAGPSPTPVLRFGREATWVTPPRSSRSLCLFTACDAESFEQAAAMVRSLDTFSPGLAVVLHLVNPSRHELDRAHRLQTLLAHTAFALSAEHTDLGALEAGGRRAWVDAARHFRLAEVIGELDTAVLTLPPASLVIAPLTAEVRPAGPVARRNASWFFRPGAAADRFLQHWAHGLAEDVTPLGARDPPAMAQLAAATAGSDIEELAPRLADELMDDEAAIWTPAGGRPPTDLRFLVIQRLLSTGQRDRLFALRAASELLPGLSSQDRFGRLVQAAKRHLPPWVALFVPRLDQPWGAASTQRLPPSIAAETLALRLYWKDFASRLANAIERQGVHVEVFEWPLRDIVPENVDTIGASLALIPHRCKLDYAAGLTRPVFFMQEYFRWVFVVDPDGWSAASSRYPVQRAWFDQAPPGAFDTYRDRLARGELSSKFGQPVVSPRADLEASGDIPRGPYVFLPLQIPHDQSIRYFSSVGMAECVQAWMRWSQSSGVPLVLKPHPANPKAMAEFAMLPRSELLYWSEASVQDLIENASVVSTINSGVGFEALLQLKPVITLGRAEYDCVTINARIDALGEAWSQAMASRPEDRLARYRDFVDWFLGSYAVDLSIDSSANLRLAALAAEICRLTAPEPGRPPLEMTALT